MELKIMSYNTQHCLNYITQEIDYDLFANTIKEWGADIVGFQEMRDKGEREDFEPQTAILAEKLGFYHYFAKAIDHRGANPYGNALISRYPIRSARTVAIPDPEKKIEGGYYESRCVLVAEIEVGGKIVHIVVTHFGLNPDEQENAVETVIKLVENERTVLMGDFNATPDDKVLIPLKEKLTDTEYLIDGNKFTFPSDEPDRKIDYIFVTKELTVKSASILPVVTSDHRPYFVVVEI